MNDDNDDDTAMIAADALADAARGDADAQAYLGRCYLHGWDEFPTDLDRARVWFQRAAAQGDPDGQFNLAYLHETGEGVPEDEDEAYRLYSLAAAQGHEGAIERLSQTPRRRCRRLHRRRRAPAHHRRP